MSPPTRSPASAGQVAPWGTWAATLLLLLTGVAGGCESSPLPNRQDGGDASGAGVADATVEAGGPDAGNDVAPIAADSVPVVDSPALADAAGATDAGADQVVAPPLGPLVETKLLDDRICDVVWWKGRWVAGTHRGELGPEAIGLRAIDLDGRLGEGVELAQEINPNNMSLAGGGDHLAVAWLKLVEGGHVVSFALATDLAGMPQVQVIARAGRPRTITHAPHVAMAWNGSAFGVLHGNESASELVILAPDGVVAWRVPGAPARYPGLFGRLVVGTKDGFAWLESCPDRGCVRVRRTAAQDGSEGQGYEVAHGDDFALDGNTVGGALAYDATTDEVWGALAGRSVLRFDGRGHVLTLAPALPLDAPHRGRSVDAFFDSPAPTPAFHVAWTGGSQTFHRDGSGAVSASEVRDLYAGGRSNAVVLAGAPAAIGLFSSRNATCKACDPPPASAWYTRLPRR